MLPSFLPKVRYCECDPMGITHHSKCVRFTKDVQKSNQKSDQKILAAIRSNPTITIEELKKQTGCRKAESKKSSAN